MSTPDAGTQIQTGEWTAHQSLTQGPNVLHPIDAATTPATLPAAVRVPVADGPADSGPLVGGVMPNAAMFAEQAAAGEADCRAAQASAQAAELGRREHYMNAAMPIDAGAIDPMQFPAIGEDPGAGVGNTLPSLGFFDPPRNYGGPEGAPGYGSQGNEPPTGYQAPAQ